VRTMHDARNILIIGDGFAAAAMVIHLLRAGGSAASITVVGPKPLGKGNAYDCGNSFFRLNIREDLPIVFSDDPLHFARWAADTLDDPDAKTDAGYFYRRHDFGRYVAELFANTPGARDVAHYLARVTQIARNGECWSLQLDNGQTLSAQQVVLATGNAPPKWPCPVSMAPDVGTLRIASHLIENPWPGNYLESIGKEERVMLLGGGLTALDAINALAGQGHRGKVSVVSPRPYFPPAQAPWARQHEPQWPGNLTPARLVRFMRRYLPDVPTNTTQWQNAWEELRPELNRIWQTFSATDRKKLIKRVGWAWSLYRFRASPQTIAAYERMRAADQIGFVVGRAKHIVCDSTGVRVEMSNGGRVTGDRLVNCTGVASDPLLDQLIADKLAVSDALGQSIAVDAGFRVINPNAEASPNLWMIGPGTGGSLGDVVAASAISKQAEQLAMQMVGRARLELATNGLKVRCSTD
jgi:uncharacterized NAD(P)/FAD-binding protein YdhS